ncbi:MAG: hypothetical protein FWD78_16735 [Treponema sp.]|nr:hypothetical protein [Treponema sp.]
MAKASLEDKNQYYDKIRPCREIIRSLLGKEQETLKILKRDNTNAAFIRLGLVDEMINLTSYYIILSSVSQSMLKLRSEEALNEGRKSLYKAVIYLEEVVSGCVDSPYSDYEDKLALIASVNSKDRYELVCKLGLGLSLLKNAYGYNTKWKWAFVELEGRYAAAAKNFIDLKNAVTNHDPRSPDYEPSVRHMRLIKKLLMQTADRYREKYELSTNRIDDFKMGINFLNALRRLHTILGERNDADTVKKKTDIWSAKLELDIKKAEEPDTKKTEDKKPPAVKNDR